MLTDTTQELLDFLAETEIDAPAIAPMPAMRAPAVIAQRPPAQRPPNARALVAEVIDAAQDFEFYPTTREIIAALIRDIQHVQAAGSYHNRFSSVLDIGAGNGKVLDALYDASAGERDTRRLELAYFYAIEKSTRLCQELHERVLIVGTDLAEQSLISKPVDIIFSNPPYSDFAQWATKIIREAAATVVYLVIPERWQASGEIADALKFRDAKTHVVGNFDFEHAEDRTARAKVQLLSVELHTSGRHDKNVDAFERFFDEQFGELKRKFAESQAPKNEDGERDQHGFGQLVVGPSYPERIVSLYNAEMAKVQRNYQLVSELDVELLREFEISPPRIMACLQSRLSGLKNDYWREVFSHLNTVTDRLTSKSRQTLLDTLHKQVHVDFTVSNICAVLIWLIKNANRFIDSQLIDTYELMVDKCNVQMYKSNQRAWVDGWRYHGEPDKNSHYALDYRIVTHRLGGIKSGYSWDKGLEESAALFLGDLCTLARNLGFSCSTIQGGTQRSSRDEWQPGEKVPFYFTDSAGRRQLLFDVRAFKNRNLHLRLHQTFILALNVEHGRLKGWLRTPEEASQELRDPQAATFFQSNALLLTGDPALLLC